MDFYRQKYGIRVPTAQIPVAVPQQPRPSVAGIMSTGVPEKKLAAGKKSPPVDIPEKPRDPNTVDLQYIIDNKPPLKIVRGFFKTQVGDLEDTESE